MAKRAQLQEWRSWAQFVFNGGGPVINTDDELRLKICAAFDATQERINILEQRIKEMEMAARLNQINQGAW